MSDPNPDIFSWTYPGGHFPPDISPARTINSGMRACATFQIIPCPVGRLGLGLGSGPHVVGRLG